MSIIILEYTYTKMNSAVTYNSKESIKKDMRLKHSPEREEEFSEVCFHFTRNSSPPYEVVIVPPSRWLQLNAQEQAIGFTTTISSWQEGSGASWVCQGGTEGFEVTGFPPGLLNFQVLLLACLWLPIIAELALWGRRPNLPPSPWRPSAFPRGLLSFLHQRPVTGI